jgi:hypothetical protein
MSLQMCVFSLLFSFLKTELSWPTAVGHMQPPWRTTVARWLPAAVGILQPLSATAVGHVFAQPLWATTVIVVHDDWLSKLKIFETVV